MAVEPGRGGGRAARLPREGFACNPSLHRTHTCREIGTLLNRLSARAFVTEDGWGADRAGGELDAVLAAVPTLRAVYAPETFPAPGPAAGPAVADPDKVAYLAFTSGTTGAPKCVMHSDNTLLANGRELVATGATAPARCSTACRRYRTTSPGSGSRSGSPPAACSSPTTRPRA